VFVFAADFPVSCHSFSDADWGVINMDAQKALVFLQKACSESNNTALLAAGHPECKRSLSMLCLTYINSLYCSGLLKVRSLFSQWVLSMNSEPFKLSQMFSPLSYPHYSGCVYTLRHCQDQDILLPI